MSVTPYYDDGNGIVIYHGDSRTVLPSLPAGSVQCVATDPPYNVSHRNGRDGTTAGGLRRKDGTVRTVRRDFGAWDRDWEPAPFLAETVRLLAEGGSLVAFVSEFLVADYLASGLTHKSLLYWIKDNPAPSFGRLYVRAVEMAVWQVKGDGWCFEGGGYRRNDYRAPILNGFRAVNVEARAHPTQKPVELMRWILETHSRQDDVILDPFMGSGTTLRAAKDLGRRAIGIEIDEHYCAVAVERLSQEVLAL